MLFPERSPFDPRKGRHPLARPGALSLSVNLPIKALRDHPNTPLIDLPHTKFLQTTTSRDTHVLISGTVYQLHQRNFIDSRRSARTPALFFGRSLFSTQGDSRQHQTQPNASFYTSRLSFRYFIPKNFISWQATFHFAKRTLLTPCGCLQ